MIKSNRVPIVTICLTVLICLISIYPYVKSQEMGQELKEVFKRDRKYRQGVLLLKDHLSKLEIAEKEYFYKRERVYYEGLNVIRNEILKDFETIKLYSVSGDLEKSLKQHFIITDKLSEVLHLEGVENLGLIGEARRIVHRVEEYIKKNATDKDYVNYLQIRRFEKDYLLRRKIKYYQKLVLTVDKAKARLPRKYANHYDDYLHLINQIQEASLKKKDLYEQLNWSITEIQVSVLRLDAQYREKIIESSFAIQENQRRMSLALIIFSIITSLGAVALLKVFRGHNAEIRNLNLDLNNKIDQINEIQNKLISQEKLASLGNLATGIAHEIKNPLNFIVSSIEGLKMIYKENIKDKLSIEDEQTKKQIDEDFTFLIGSIEEGAIRSDLIVKGMLDLSSGNIDKEEVIYLDELLDTSLTLAMNIEKNKLVRPIKVQKEYSAKGKIIGSKLNLEKALTNILQNSLYFINQHIKMNPELDGVLSVSIEESEDQIIIEIIDNGIGIDDEILENKRFMEPFYTTKPTGEGVGLGLSITNDIVIHHNGELTFNNFDKKLKATIIFKR